MLQIRRLYKRTIAFVWSANIMEMPLTHTISIGDLSQFRVIELFANRDARLPASEAVFISSWNCEISNARWQYFARRTLMKHEHRSIIKRRPINFERKVNSTSWRDVWWELVNETHSAKNTRVHALKIHRYYVVNFNKTRWMKSLLYDRARKSFIARWYRFKFIASCKWKSTWCRYYTPLYPRYKRRRIIKRMRERSALKHTIYIATHMLDVHNYHSTRKKKIHYRLNLITCRWINWSDYWII